LKSFIGLTVKDFDNSYGKEIEKRYDKHEIQRYSKEKKENGLLMLGDDLRWILKAGFRCC